MQMLALRKLKGRRVMCSGINVGLALALRGIISMFRQTDTGGVTCLINPLKLHQNIVYTQILKTPAMGEDVAPLPRPNYATT